MRSSSSSRRTYGPAALSCLVASIADPPGGRARGITALPARAARITESARPVDPAPSARDEPELLDQLAHREPLGLERDLLVDPRGRDGQLGYAGLAELPREPPERDVARGHVNPRVELDSRCHLDDRRRGAGADARG